MIGYRRAAVALHGMHEEDRQWILAELGGEDRVALERFIDELNNLGFARDEAITTRLISLSARGLAPTNPHDRIEYATAAQMYGVLEAEPSSVTAQLLKCAHWPWEDAFLRMLDPLRRDKVRNLMTGYTVVAPSRKAVLIEVVAKRLQDGLAINGVSSSHKGMRKPAALYSVRRALDPLSKLVTSWKR
ncbi:MAG: hypothetical protein HYS18_05710 [Burkholderiales bacterium]|nr:hypothetical protein [Burkholderiales bacterium]